LRQKPVRLALPKTRPTLFEKIRQKPVRLALPKTRPTLFGKILGGVFEPNEIKTDHES
jgi:hypothetical protein